LKQFLVILTLAFVLSACMFEPTNGQNIGKWDSLVHFAGFNRSPGEEVEIHAFDPDSNTWKVIGSTKSGTIQLGDGYYIFDTYLAVPKKYWIGDFGGEKYRAQVKGISGGSTSLFTYEEEGFKVKNPQGALSPESPVVTLVSESDLDTMVLTWPVPGTDGKDWVINNYVDLDRTTNMRDYKGNTDGSAKTYDNGDGGHRGIDIDVPNFRAMDNNFSVLAAADGKVIELENNEPDRNMSMTCTCDWNFVTLEHKNGVRTIYGHFKKKSIGVKINESVNAGDVLGVVGSSGQSTQPHLHFEVRDKSGTVIDPFALGMWSIPPVYDTPIGIMDISLHSGLPSLSDAIDPKTDVQVISPGGSLGIGVSLAGGEKNDTVTLRLLDPNGTQHDSRTWKLKKVNRHDFGRFEMNVGTQTGTWTLEADTNNVNSWVGTFSVK